MEVPTSEDQRSIEEALSKMSLNAPHKNTISKKLQTIIKEAKNPQPYVKNSAFQSYTKESIAVSTVGIPLKISTSESKKIEPMPLPKTFKSPIKTKGKSTSPFEVHIKKRYTLEDFKDLDINPDKLIPGRSNGAKDKEERGYKIEKLKEIIRVINSRVPPDQKITIGGTGKEAYVNAIRRFFRLPVIEK